MVGRPLRSMLGSFALVGSLVMLTACADSWPDSLDPSDWYAAGVGEEAAPTSDEPVPGADQDYPNLADVPDAPTNVSTPEQIDAVANALSADLANAQYTTDIQRVDDETTPEAMPLPQPEVVEVTEDTTYIEPGGEIEIAEAVAAPVAEAPAAPPGEVAAADEVAAAETELQAAAEAEAMAMAEMDQPQPEPMEGESLAVGESRVETETIRGEDGELVGTVTRVVVAEPVIEEEIDGEPVAVVVPAAPEVVVPDEPSMEPVAVAEPAAETAEVVEETVVVVQPPAETAEVAVAAPAAVTDTPPMEGQSLVAMSERDPGEPIDVEVLPEQVVVVPEYVAELAPAEVTPVTEETVAMASQEAAADMAADADAGNQTRVEQQTVTDSSTGELVGSVTRTITTTRVVEAAPGTEVVAVEDEDGMSFTEVAETLAPSAEPQATVEPVVTSVPQTTAVTGQGAAQADAPAFEELIVASGPDAGTAEQPVVIATPAPAAQNQAVFTSQPGIQVNEVLAAIIRFGDGSSALGNAERDIVRQLVLLHKERGGHIRLVGHASRPAGGMETAQQELVNFNISLDRATAVAEELIRQGVPRTDVIIEAAGDNQASSDAAQDRRVDVLFGA